MNIYRASQLTKQSSIWCNLVEPDIMEGNVASLSHRVQTAYHHHIELPTWRALWHIDSLSLYNYSPLARSLLRDPYCTYDILTTFAFTTNSKQLCIWQT